MLAALGRFTYRQRWPIVVVFIVAFAPAAMFAPRLSERVSSGGFEFSASDSVAAGEILQREFGVSVADLVIVFTDPVRTVDEPAYHQAVDHTRSALLQVPLVQAVESHLDGRSELVSRDRRTTFATIHSAGTPTETQSHFNELRAIAAASPVPAVITGLPAVSAELAEASERDMVRAELIALPLVLLVLLFVFGSVIAAGLPLLLAFMSITVTLATLFGLSHSLEFSVFVSNVATLLGLGIGIDYALLMVSRFREELRRRPVDAAVEATVARAGKSVVFSGLAVIVGLSGLLVFEMAALRSIGIGGIVVVAFLVLGALTLLPAVLGILGPRVNHLTVPLRRSSGDGTGWARLARWVMRFAAPILIVTIAALLVLGSPFLRVRLGVTGADVLPADAPARVGRETLEREFGRGTLPSVLVTLTDPAGIVRARNAASIDKVSNLLMANSEISSVTSLTGALRDAGLGDQQIALLLDADPARLPSSVRTALGRLASETTTIIRAESSRLPNSAALRDLVRQLRTLPPSGLELHVGGEVAVLMDFVDAVYGTFPWAALLVLGLTYLTLLFLFGSVVLPLKAVLMNALSITAAYGALVFIFQDGHLAGLLRFEPRGFVDATIPVLLFFVLFGLSMDYEVFLLTRVRESWQRSGDNTASVAQGLQRTAGIITGAAAILIVVSAAFVTADIVLVKALGVGVALAILVDATLVRVLLVPSTMRLLGGVNWWAPGPIRRLTRSTSHFYD